MKPKLNHCKKCKAHFSMEPGKHVCPPWMLNRVSQDELKIKSQAPVPVEFCPECYSLKRKPSKDCLNHAGQCVAQSDIPSLTEDLAEAMTKEIASKIIKVDTVSEGRSAQRRCYLEARKMLKKLMAEYRRVCKEAYNV